MRVQIAPWYQDQFLRRLILAIMKYVITIEDCPIGWVKHEETTKRSRLFELREQAHTVGACFVVLAGSSVLQTRGPFGRLNRRGSPVKSTGFYMTKYGFLYDILRVSI